MTSWGGILFLSTPSARRATVGDDVTRTIVHNFYPRPPRGGRPPARRDDDLQPGISIHALREEGDSIRSASELIASVFPSTPSARRATSGRYRVLWMPSYFYPRPPRGGRPARCCCAAAQQQISIHALREEGDGTMSARTCARFKISIHALREEGDTKSLSTTTAVCIFLSTPSARRATCIGSPPKPLGIHFYPRPPRGGRQCAKTGKQEWN